MDQTESNELLQFLAEGNASAEDFDTNFLLREPIADERDMTTRSQDTFDSFGDFADDIDIDLSEEDLSLHHQSISGSLEAVTAADLSPSPAVSPTVQKPSASVAPPFAATPNSLPVANDFLSVPATSGIPMRQIPTRAASYSEGDQQRLLLQIQQMSLMQIQQQQQQQVMLPNNLTTLRNTSFHESVTSNTTATTTTSREQSLFSQQRNMQGLSPSSQHSLPLAQGIPSAQTPANLNDAMEKLCETMKRSAVTRNLVKQLGVTRSNSGVGLMRTNSGAALKRSSSAKGSIGEMARMAPIRRPSNSKHSIKRGVLPQSSQHSLDGSNHVLQVDGRTIAHF
ncbi:hypothetical protein FisN_14Hu371 [Fistulifera solaris]|jgi:hypothetical protein|uniref:Uncharacterized protein n=1 Tax=Fistulifera solaris TaxID=1519565 RepID=A0A1Z5K4Q2_FISSO|nr:hypothetical protein FisN_14Hu371 [Fistulifera solaris]|eukprot:GAX21162.1 hypothetical protein FisN_14Hu371 [Fistulifera solaris]